VVVFGTYLTRAIALPVRRAALMAGRLAAGDLHTRVPETGVGEVRTLERAFNTMAGSLQLSRDELRVLAEEQAALRRVATLVARAVPPEELFGAVTVEVRRLLGADTTQLLRFEPDGTAAGVGGRRVTMEGEHVAAEVRRTGRPAGRERSVGTPITVGGRLWGVMVAAYEQEQDLAPDSEERMAQFTDLVATAIANVPSWPPRAPASWPRPTRRAAASSATSTTARSSASSTPSSRSSSPCERWATPTRRRSSSCARRSTTPSARRPSCATSPTGSSPRRSIAAA
jgi:HAMP domain-containing protein